MASVVKGRRPQDPTITEIERRKAEILVQRFDEIDAEYMSDEDRYDLLRTAYTTEATNALLLQKDESEPLDLTDHWQRLPIANCEVIADRIVPAKPTAEPREMSKADICNVDLGSLRLLNLIDDSDDGERYTLGRINPETADLGADSLAALQEATYQRIAFKLKTETKTQRDVTAFRSKRR